MSKEKILVIEDEDSIRELVLYNLEKGSYTHVRGADSGETGLREAREFLPDLILLDLMLPGIDGLAVCRMLKADPATASIPIIMLTAKGEESDIIVGLEMGADDYITKPFSPKVLIARIRSVLRRTKNPEETTSAATAGTLRRGSLFMNRGTRQAQLDGHDLNMTFSEFEILFLLAKRPGWVYTRNQIVNAVKGDDYPVTERAIDVQIVSIRRKLGEDAERIETVRGVGYRFNLEPGE